NEIRTLFENHQVNELLLQNLCHAYNSEVKNLALFVRRAKDFFPYLNCGLATIYLRAILKTGKVVNGKYKDQNHTFLLLECIADEVTIIDITSDQYGGPSIYIGPIQAPWRYMWTLS